MRQEVPGDEPPVPPGHAQPAVACYFEAFFLAVFFLAVFFLVVFFLAVVLAVTFFATGFFFDAVAVRFFLLATPFADRFFVVAIDDSPVNGLTIDLENSLKIMRLYTTQVIRMQ